MQSRRMKYSRKHRRRRSLKAAVYSIMVCVMTAAVFVIWAQWEHKTAKAPETITETAASENEGPTGRIVDFHMLDTDRGVLWISRSDQTDELRTTNDGGLTWTVAAADTPAEIEAAYARTVASETELGKTAANVLGEGRVIAGGDEETIRKIQFVTNRLGWALIGSDETDGGNIWFTYDGGERWLPLASAASNAEAVSVLESERTRLQGIALEAAYFHDHSNAAPVLKAGHALIPDTAAPGDVVLFRSSSPGSVEWQGKDYALQSFGAGYYTYLPISMQVKPGTYAIGNTTLTVKEKTFDTQYLQVTEEQNSMRQNTERIQADQVKINEARSTSADRFLFDPESAFIQPIEGRLTTPYGFTRYVNGAYAGSHTAIDLAAPTGTPIQATNDGVVALADDLYLTGLTVYIDHGMHLFSQYAHLSELKVKTGDHVKKGDIIGLVGSTGFSTGPHLHFTFWAHNVPVNPNLFFDQTPFRWIEQQME